MKNLSKNILRGLYCMTLATIFVFLSVATVGCQKETKKEPSPDEIKKAQQQQIKMSQREMQDQGSGGKR